MSMIVHHMTVSNEWFSIVLRDKNKDNDSWLLLKIYHLATLLFNKDDDGDNSYATPPSMDEGSGYGQSNKTIDHIINKMIVSFGLWSIQNLLVNAFVQQPLKLLAKATWWWQLHHESLHNAIGHYLFCARKNWWHYSTSTTTLDTILGTMWWHHIDNGKISQTIVDLVVEMEE